MNCALWSAEVFEDDDGSLKNVHMAVIRGKQLVSMCILPLQKKTTDIHGSLLLESINFYLYFLLLQRCEFCQKSGATVGCCLTSCTSNYHFMCSRAKNCVFLDDKKVYCQRHRDLIKGEVRFFFHAFLCLKV